MRSGICSSRFFTPKACRTCSDRCEARRSTGDVRRHFQLAKSPSAGCVAPPVGSAKLRDIPEWPIHCERCDGPALNVAEYCRLLAEVQGWRLHFGRQLERQRIDALLGPVSPVPAFLHGEFYASAGFIYTGMFNLLGVPAGTVPVRRVQSQDGGDPPASRDAVDQLIWRTQQNSEGLPVGVQIVGPWWSDDRVLGLMHRLQQTVDWSVSLPTNFAT